MVYLTSDIDGSTAIKRYDLTNVVNISYGASTEPTVLSLPEMEEPIVFNFGGRKNRVRVDWWIIDSDVDLSEGTNATPVLTVADQITYLEEKFVTADVGTTVCIYIPEIGKSYCGISAGFSWVWAGGEKRVKASLSIIPSLV